VTSTPDAGRRLSLVPQSLHVRTVGLHSGTLWLSLDVMVVRTV
jgi:hypothetical protein